MANEAQRIDNPTSTPTAVSTGYQAQNTVMASILNGIDRTVVSEDTGQVILDISGPIDVNGVLYSITSAVILTTGLTAGLNYIYLDGTGANLTPKLTTTLGTFDKSKNAYYTAGGKRILNTVINYISGHSYINKMNEGLHYNNSSRGISAFGSNRGGYFSSSAGYGLESIGVGKGGLFTASAGIGVDAEGTSYGGYFVASSGRGVYASGTVFGLECVGTGTGTGIYSTGAVGGQFIATDTRGIWGQGVTYGVYGEASASGATGVYGIANNGTAAIGVEAVSSSGLGVKGTGAEGGGYFLASGSNKYGVHGVSNSGSSAAGVYGISSSGRGVWGVSTLSNGVGVQGTSNTGSTAVGVRGESSSGRGVEGIGTTYGGGFTASAGRGVEASGTTYDFYASGAGTNYGPFTGGHEVLLDISRTYQRGMIVKATGSVNIREGSISSTLPKVTLAETENDSAIFGVFNQSSEAGPDWYTPQDNDSFGAINALGEGLVLVTNKNGDIVNGDLITSSVIAGYGQKQNDDIFHSYTVAKCTETVDWSQITDTIEYNGIAYKCKLIACTYHSA